MRGGDGLNHDSNRADAEIGLDSGNILKVTSARCHRVSPSGSAAETTPGAEGESYLMWAKPRDSGERVPKGVWAPGLLQGLGHDIGQHRSCT